MRYNFFENKMCDFYPCHDMKEINCMFCFCPFYYSDKCPGTPIYMISEPIKDCSKCTYVHKRKNFDNIISQVFK